jgi:WD40 repeat protein
MSVTEYELLRYEPRFYVTGGTLPHDARCYIRRRADDELYEGIQRGEFCYLLTSRQMGKSSLMVRTAARLRAEGTSVVVLDLTTLGRSLSLEQWYRGLLSRIGAQLGLEEELDTFWRDHSFLGPLQRWMAAVHGVVLDRCPERLVVFIDELDVIRGLPFPTDEFIAAIRACYNQRAQDPTMERLSFCLLGVATPAELVKDVRTTPFNIGRRIELNDFTDSEAAPLAQGLSDDPVTGRKILGRVLFWSGGHPYLTQRLCQAVVDEPGPVQPVDVDRLSARIFFNSRSHETDDNLAFVRQRLLRSESDLTSVLEIYSRVMSGHRPVQDDETNLLVSTLRLSGIVRVHENRLRIRNRIYARVFDKSWIQANMPNAEVRRQRLAYRKGLARATAVWVIVVAAVSVMGVNSAKWARRADEGKLNARRFVYISQIGLAHRVWESGDVGRAAELVDGQIPGRGDEDLRGFEWDYLKRLCENKSLATITTFSYPNNTLAGVAVDGYHTNCAELSPDGKIIAAALNNGLVKLFDFQSCRELRTFQTNEDRIQSLTFSPNGEILAIGSWNGLIKLLRVPTGEEIGVLRGHSDVVSAIVFSRDGSIIASGSFDATVRIWDVAGRSNIYTLPGRKVGVVSLAFSPTRRSLAVGYGDTLVRLWDLASKSAAHEIWDHKDAVGGVFANGGQTIAVGRWEKMVKLERAFAAKRESRIMLGHALPVVCVAYSPDGKVLATAGADGNVRLWTEDGRKLISTLRGHKDAIICIRFSPDGKTLATGIWDGTAKLWDVSSGREMAVLKEHKGEVTSVLFSRDSRTLATSSWDGTIKLWNASPRQESVALQKCKAPIIALACSTKAGMLAAGCQDNTLRIWDMVTRKEIPSLSIHSGPVLCAAFSPDGKILASGSVDACVKFWDTVKKKVFATLLDHKGSVLAVAFSPDGTTLASTGVDGTVRLWNVKSQRRLAILPWHIYAVTSVAFSPDGLMLATGSIDGKVKIWDLRTNRELTTLSGHLGGITSVSFSPRGDILATGSNDGTVRFWNVANWKQTAVLSGHKGYVQSLAFSTDGRTLVTGSDDTTVKLWNIATRQEMLTLQPDNTAVQSVCFAPDGGLLATAGDDGTVRLWMRAEPASSVQASR